MANVKSVTAKQESIWIETGPQPPAAARLEEDVSVDAVVIGGGIVGITTALLLKEAGAQVALLEAGRLARGVSGQTTAKLSSQHGLIYSRLGSDFGPEAAQTYGAANEAALDWIADRVEREQIDCDFRRQPAYAYVLSASELAQVEEEARAAVEAGLPAALVASSSLPFPIAGAVRFDDQAEFHPCKYLLALASGIAGQGSTIYEDTAAVAVGSDGDQQIVATVGGSVRADHVIVATHYPFLDRSLAFARVHASRSYAIACRINGDPPEGMHISAEGPKRSIRALPIDGEELLLIGGESHKPGTGGDTKERYRGLETFAAEHWQLESVEYRWSSQDNITLDGLPYVGRLTPRSEQILMATGFAKWGLTGGTAAAKILADTVLGKDPSPAAGLFDPWRLTPRASLGTLLKETAETGMHMVGDRLASPGLRSVDSLGRDEGDIVRLGGKKVAAYRDKEGNLTAVSSRCTHLGCQVKWNGAERSWDCPCHGSRFATDGRVLHGPALEPLARKTEE